MASNRLRDQIALFDNPSKAALAAFAAISKTQGVQPGAQVMGLAIALVCICESANVNLSDVIGKAVRMTDAADGPFVPQIQAIRDYAVGELA